jgi:hypothetical protein
VVPDVDGDGRDDIAVSAYNEPSGSVPGAGRAYLYSSSSGGPAPAPLAAAVPVAEAAAGATPEATALAAPAPNPTTGRVAFRFTLGAAGPARLAVYDALGREVAVLVDALQEAGSHEAAFDASALAPGVYVVRLAARGQRLVQRFTLLR